MWMRWVVLAAFVITPVVVAAEPAGVRQARKVVDEEITRLKEIVGTLNKEYSWAKKWMDEAAAALMSCNEEKRCTGREVEVVFASTESAAMLAKESREYTNKLLEMYKFRETLKRDVVRGR